MGILQSKQDLLIAIDNAVSIRITKSGKEKFEGIIDAVKLEILEARVQYRQEANA